MEEGFRMRGEGSGPQRRRLIALAFLTMAAVSLACGGPVVGFVDKAKLSSELDEGRLPPESVTDLVRGVDLIAQGIVVEVVDGGEKVFATAVPTATGSSDADDDLLDPIFDFGKEQAARMVQVSIRVDEVLYAAPTGQVDPSTVIRMSVWEDLAHYATPTPPSWYKTDWPKVARRLRATEAIPEVGDKRLFLLWDQHWAPVVKGYYGTLTGAYSILDLRGPEVMLNSSPPIPIDITENTAPEAFLEELKAALQER